MPVTMSILVALTVVTATAAFLLPRSPTDPQSPAFPPKWVWITWLSMIAAFFWINLFRGYFLPSSVLRITDEENFVRRYSVELKFVLNLLIAIAAVITVIVLLFHK